VDDDKFIPRLSRMRAGGGRKARRYLSRIAAAAARATNGPGRRSARFDGSRIGRGASIGRLVGSRAGNAGSRQRRAVVKTRLVRLGGKGLPAARAHLRYLQRDGVTREGLPGKLYSAELDEADGKAFLERGQHDRHQFRFIVSAEDADQYDDLKPLTRRLLAQMEKDLGTRLDWVAVDHFNTGHPHTHIILRGVDENRQNLIIAREYIAHGVRSRAAELVSLDLGPRTVQEIEARLRHDIAAERLTEIDRRLLRAMDAARLVTAADRDPLTQSLKAGRLQTLGRLGLAKELGRGTWRLADDLESSLRSLGERGDIIRTMQRAMAARNLASDWSGAATDPASGPVIGRVVAHGLVDEHRDRHYLIVDGTDGRAHYLDIGDGDAAPAIPEGAIVQVAAAASGERPSDRTINEIAAANAGRYSSELHSRHDMAATPAFIEAHVRRLDALRRAGVRVVRNDDQSWSIPADYLKQVQRIEAERQRTAPVAIEVLSPVPLDQLVNAHAATWLDRTLARGAPEGLRDAGFGRDVRAALAMRAQWLIEQGLAERTDNSVRLRQNALLLLEGRELATASQNLAAELGKRSSAAQTGEPIEGHVTRRVQLISGTYALIERSQDFTLVPWRPALERKLGRTVSATVRSGGSIDWTFGRQRSGREIS
jgi:type IV secretory pathway VirD2 relaxase